MSQMTEVWAEIFWMKFAGATRWTSLFLMLRNFTLTHLFSQYTIFMLHEKLNMETVGSLS